MAGTSAGWLTEADQLLKELWPYIDVFEACQEVERYIADTYDDVDRELAAQAVITADQEAKRRGASSARDSCPSNRLS